MHLFSFLDYSECSADDVIALEQNEVLILTSPGFPGNYFNSLTCRWTVTPSLDRRVSIRFIQFYTEGGFDYLYIGTEEDQYQLIYNGYINLPILDIVSGVNEGLLIVFDTDGSVTYPGFALQIQDILIQSK